MHVLTRKQDYPRQATQWPRLREAQFEDYEQISTLQVDNALTTRSRDDWKHFWIGNPAYTEAGRSWPIGWVLELNGQVVGSLSNIPAFYEFNGQRLLAAVTRAWVVAPGYRSLSVLLLDEYFRQKVDLFVSTTASPQAYAALIELGSSRVPSGRWDCSAVWVTNYPLCAVDLLRRAKVPLAKLLCCPVAAGLLAHDVLQRKLATVTSQAQHQLQVQHARDFDERFDAFWQLLKQECRSVLLADRSRQTLEAHFRYALQQERLRVLTIDNGDGIESYAVLIERDWPPGTRRLTLVDFQARCGKQSQFYTLLTCALANCRREGIEILDTIGVTIDGVEVSSIAPYQRRQRAWKYLYKVADPHLARTLRDAAYWKPSLFDGDASL